MKTPKEYNNLIKENKITFSILGEVLYSINKRAKNWRNKKREYRINKYDKYNNYEKALEQEQMYYKMKSNILARLKPTCIHKEIKVKDVITKVYDYEPEYLDEDIDTIVESYYFDRDLNRDVFFKKVKDVIYTDLYYLFYEVGDFTFHNPIEESDIIKYELDVKIIDNLNTNGKDINELLSTHFCKKVYKLFVEGKLEIV